MRGAALALVATLTLGGCLPAGLGLSGRPAPTSFAVAEGAVVVAGPPGFCVDEGASREGPEGAFVLLGSCAALSGDPGAPRPLTPAVLTASVVPGAAPGVPPDTMLQFLRSEEGRAAIARDGRAESLKVLEGRVENGAALVLVEDGAAAAVPGTAARYWRGVFEVNGRMVTLSALGFAARPLSREAGLALLRGFGARVRTASAGAAAPPG